MDPREITSFLEHEVALNGPDGIKVAQLWERLSKYSGFDIHKDLQAALAEWIATKSDIALEGDVYKATDDNQWYELTGFPKSGNSIGQKAFELLCAISQARENGISTVQASKITGQDLRSLFGRAQILVNNRLILKYPVIQGGVHTNMLIFHEYASAKAIPSSKTVDKNKIYSSVINFIKSGHNNMKLMSEVTTEMSKLMSLEENRKKPALRRFLKEMVQDGYIRRIRVIEPDNPEKFVSCFEFIKEYTVQNTQEGTALGHVISFKDDIELGDKQSSDSEGTDSVDEEEDDRETDLYEITGNEWSGVNKELSSNKANLVLPIANQIQDFVRQSGSGGTSAMDISKHLTGKFYKKCLSKYLDLLTNETSPEIDSFKMNIEHLSLMRGVDFNRRVKFYRYFSKPFYLKVDSFTEGWGNFPHEPLKNNDISLRVLCNSLDNSIPGSCSIIKTEEGNIRPLFHGEHGKGKIIMRCVITRNESKPKKIRGRPRKTRATDSSNKHVEKLEEKPNEIPLRVLVVGSRSWTGGVCVCDTRFQPSRWILQKFEKLELPELEDVPVEQSKQINNKSIGSLALAQRIEIIMKIVAVGGGVIQGGTPLLEMYNMMTPGENSIDRRTMSNVCQKLINDGKLEQLFFNVSTVSGATKVKTLFIDPLRIPDKDENPLIKETKRKIIATEMNKRSVVTRKGVENTNNFPVREITQEDFNVIRPPRIRSTRSGRIDGSKSKQKTRYGPSAADVLGIDVDGDAVSMPKKTRIARSSKLVADPPNQPPNERLDMILNIDPLLTQSTSSSKPAQKEQSGVTSHGQNQDSLTTQKEDLSSLKNSEIVKPIPRSTENQINYELLAKIVIVSRSFFNEKLSAPIDWKLVSACMPGNYSQRSLKKVWPKAKASLIQNEDDSKSADIVFKKLQEFEDLFMHYYKKGQIEYPVDLSNSVEITKRYVRWWSDVVKHDPKCIDTQLRESDLTMTSNGNSSLSKNVLLDYVNPSHHIHDPFLNLQNQSSIVGAEKILFKTSYGVSITSKFQNFQREAVFLNEAEMRVRAMIAADEDSFEPRLAALELSGLSNEETDEARASLISKRLIKWGRKDDDKIPHGRPYVLSDHVLNVLASKLDDQVPLIAAEYSKIIETKRQFDIDPTITDGEMIVLVECATIGVNGHKVQLKRIGEKVGLLSNTYKSRGIDKQEFECNIQCNIVSDFDSIDFESQKVRDLPRCIPPPYSSNDKRPYLWQTKLLKSKNIWYRVSLKILSIILFRPGVTYDVIYDEMCTILTADEIRDAVEALKKGGAITYTNLGALTVVPDWFNYLG